MFSASPSSISRHHPEKVATIKSPVTLHKAEFECALPLIFTSPHSGRVYSDELLQRTPLPIDVLRRSEDAYVDQLIDCVPVCGGNLLLAECPRVFVDVNRGPWELDPGMFVDRLPDYVDTSSRRAASGLGVVPRIGADGRPLYTKRLRFEEARNRLSLYYTPYHKALQMLVDEVKARFGIVVLLDMHSMPNKGSKGADFVLGNRYGRSCDGRITDQIETLLTGLGFVTLRNTPYAGGYTTEHYSEPNLGVHVIQIEINRALYMDERRVVLVPKSKKFKDKLQRFISEFSNYDWVSLLTS